MSTLTHNSMTNHHAPGLIQQIGETLHVWHERYRTRRELTNWTARELEIPLAFLGSGRYTAEIYQDAEDAGRYPKNIRVLKETVDHSTRLKAPLASGGGYAVRFVPAGP